MADDPQSRHEPVARPWELELLVSGAVTFALVQAPAVADRLFFGVEEQLAGSSRFVVFLGYYTTKLILYVLIASFVLHLAARAYWVGLIALDAIFPDGVRWEKARFGPNFLAVYRERLPRLPLLIARADAFCSVIFPFAFAVVCVFALSVVLLGGAAALAWAISTLVFGGRWRAETSVAVMAALTMPQVVVSLIDRAIGPRLDPGGRAARAIRAAAGAFYRLQVVSLYGSIITVLFTNVRRRAIYPAYVAVFLAPILLFLVKDVLVRRGALPMDGYVFVPERSDVNPSYYEDQRAPGETYGMTPSIQSDIVRDPYVKLFIPYVPDRHNETLRTRCPELTPIQRSGLRFELPSAARSDTAARQAAIECWTRLQPVTLNGQPLAPQFLVSTHPRSGARGLIAYIPTAGLPRGPNVITVGRLPRVGVATRLPVARATEPYVIRFWL